MIDFCKRLSLFFLSGRKRKSQNTKIAQRALGDLHVFRFFNKYNNYEAKSGAVQNLYIDGGPLRNARSVTYGTFITYIWP